MTGLLFRLLRRPFLALNDSRLQQRSVYELTEHMPAGTYVVTLTPRVDGLVDLAFRFVSERFLEIFGVERQALLDDPNVVVASIHPDDRDRMNADNAHAYATNEPFRWEGRVLVSGVTRWYNISSNPRRAADGVMVWEGVVTDITTRVEAQQELQRMAAHELHTEQQRRALLEQKLKTSLTAAAVVHEIQQPLAAILLNARLASQGLDQLPADSALAPLRRQLEALGRDGDRVVIAMDRIRLLLRNVETSHSPCNLCSHIESALVFLQNDLRLHHVELNCVGLDQSCVMDGDGGQLQIAVLNLLRNAVQAMHTLPVEQRRLDLELQRHAEHLELHIADTGPGFPDDHPAEFDWFLLTSTKATGMGLGLFLAQTAAANHGGYLRIGRSQALGGAEVTLVLPWSAASVPPPATGHSPE